MENVILTIYTPTYNREEELKRLYESLCIQTIVNFIWMIIDDGSIDHTAEYVEKWKKEAPFEIQYLYKKNGGVHTARDLAYRSITTELNVGIDSDDYVTENFVEKILDLWNNPEKKNLCGIIFPVCSADGQRLGSDFPKVKTATWQEFMYKYRCVGDYTIVVRSDIMRSMQEFPVYPEENLVGEGFRWIQLPEIPFLISDCCTTIHEYLNTGYSHNAATNMIRNPHGSQANALQYIKLLRYKTPKIKQYVKYIICSRYIGEKGYIIHSPHPVATAAMWPIGFVASLLYERRNKEKHKAK